MFEKKIKQFKKDLKNKKYKCCLCTEINWAMMIIFTLIAFFVGRIDLMLLCLMAAWIWHEIEKSEERDQLYVNLGIKDFWKKVGK